MTSNPRYTSQRPKLIRSHLLLCFSQSVQQSWLAHRRKFSQTSFRIRPFTHIKPFAVWPSFCAFNSSIMNFASLAQECLCVQSHFILLCSHNFHFKISDFWATVFLISKITYGKRIFQDSLKDFHRIRIKEPRIKIKRLVWIGRLEIYSIDSRWKNMVLSKIDLAYDHTREVNPEHKLSSSWLQIWLKMVGNESCPIANGR